MLLFAYRKSHGPGLGYVSDQEWCDLDAALSDQGIDAADPLRRSATITELASAGLLDNPALASATTEPTGRPLDPATLEFLPPTGRPPMVIGVGRNYGAHAAEGGLEAQETPRLFAKLPSSVIGHGAAILRPRGVEKLDWEGEIGVVIGRSLKDAAPAEALSAVAGYTPLNDVTAREFQFDKSPGQTTFAKSHDTFCPVGPAVLVAGADTAHDNFSVTTRVNGECVQEGRTDDLIFPIPDLLSFISRYVTLLPGTIVATGTPAGVGHFHDPPRYLAPGDRVEVAVSGLPTLSNTVEAA